MTTKMNEYIEDNTIKRVQNWDEIYKTIQNFKNLNNKDLQYNKMKIT